MGKDFFLASRWHSLTNTLKVQSGFFIMHAISMLMKQHSYLSVNREMKAKDYLLRQLQHRRTQLIGASKKTDDDASAAAEEESVELEIEDIDTEMEDLLLDLRNGKTQFPANVTFVNFFDFLLVPTLVYELEYPRTDR